MRRGLGGLLLFVVLYHAAFAGESAPRPPVAPEAAGEKQRLTKLWAGWRNQTQSLRIEGWWLVGLGGGPGSLVTRDQLLSLVFEKLSPLVKNAAENGAAIAWSDLEDLTADLFPLDLTKAVTDSRSAAGWERFVFTAGAGGRRMDRLSPDASGVTVRKHGTEQRYDSRLKQLSILPTATGSLVEERADFMHTPELTPLRQLEDAAEGRNRLSNRSPGGTFLLDYDPATGLTHRDIRQFSTGRHVPERIQERPLTDTGPIPFTRLLVKVDFRLDAGNESNVSRAVIYIVESATHNVEITESTFDIAVPKNTRRSLYVPFTDARRDSQRPDRTPPTPTESPEPSPPDSPTAPSPVSLPANAPAGMDAMDTH